MINPTPSHLNCEVAFCLVSQEKDVTWKKSEKQNKKNTQQAQIQEIYWQKLTPLRQWRISVCRQIIWEKYHVVSPSGEENILLVYVGNKSKGK